MKIFVKRTLSDADLVKRLKWQRKALLYLFGILVASALYFAAYEALASKFWPSMLVVQASPQARLVRTAQAAEAEPEWPDIGECEQYRPVVEKYFGKLTDEALFVAKKESGCIADRVSPKNKDGKRDYCLFQLHGETLAAQSLEVCVRRAYEKYKAGRVGKENWSAWFAVCDVNAKPKYPKIINNCS